MNTSHLTRRRVRRSALALAVSAICLPSSALAQGDTKTDYPGSAGYVGTHVPSAPQPSKAGDTPADFPGMPGGPAVEAQPISEHTTGGFDWTSAAIGAGGGGLLVVVSLAGASAASHLRMRSVRS
jgi:hypothetical protein